MTAAHPAAKMARNVGSPGSSSGVRTSAAEWAIVAAASHPPARTGHTIGAGAVAEASRQTQSAANTSAAAAVNQRSASSMPRATRGSERTRKTLSVQLSQQLGRRRDRGRAPGRAPREQLRGRRRPTSARSPLERSRPLGYARTRWRRSGKTKPAASVPRLRTSGGPPFQPAQNGANQTTPASRARSPIRPAGRAKDDEAGRHERKTRDDGKSGSEVGAPGVGRELARPARDGERA